MVSRSKQTESNEGADIKYDLIVGYACGHESYDERLMRQQSSAIAGWTSCWWPYRKPIKKRRAVCG
jgi:hypothetical protein